MNTIKDLRLKIDKVDKKILELVGERLKLVKEIGEEKQKNHIGVVDKNREQEILNNLVDRAQQLGLNPETVKKIWRVLIDAAYEIETNSEPYKGLVGEGGTNGNG